MQPVQQAITGREHQGELSTPYQALVQFYCAFNTANMAMMAANWALADEIVMDNPLGGVKRGWPAIEAVYAGIFNGQAEVYVEYHDYTIHEADGVFWAVGRERGYFRKGKEEIALAIRTSRIFRQIDDRWRQVHHHGSIEDPQLLAAYQAAVLGAKS